MQSSGELWEVQCHLSQLYKFRAQKKLFLNGNHSNLPYFTVHKSEKALKLEVTLMFSNSRLMRPIVIISD